MLPARAHGRGAGGTSCAILVGLAARPTKTSKRFAVRAPTCTLHTHTRKHAYARARTHTHTHIRQALLCVHAIGFAAQVLERKTSVLMSRVTSMLMRLVRQCICSRPHAPCTLTHVQVGYDFEKNAQAQIQLTIQVMPRALGRAMPASQGFAAGPAKLRDPNRLCPIPSPIPQVPLYLRAISGMKVSFALDDASESCC